MSVVLLFKIFIVLYCVGSSICLNSKPTNVPVCGYNEEAVQCRTICPPQNCDIAYTEYACAAQAVCEPGCDCIQDHLRNSSGICIPNKFCTGPDVPQEQCGPNEILSPCKRSCPPQTCESKYIMYSCLNEDTCTPGCVCMDGHYRNADGACIPSGDCPLPSYCDNTDRCIPTCANPNPRHCNNKIRNIQVGCECDEGYILSELGGYCLKIEECPQNQGCNGDPNAVIQKHPWQIPPTCNSPVVVECERGYESECIPFGCVCAPGYILSEGIGMCVIPEDCPGGDPCYGNSTFLACSYDCPNNYCPVDDSRYSVVCDPRYPCLPGCGCRLNNLRLSEDDPICIASYDCPPVECTRPNEVWDSCPSSCLAERCENVDDGPVTCNTFVFLCNPGCVCREGHFRDSNDICVSAAKCRELNKNCTNVN